MHFTVTILYLWHSNYDGRGYKIRYVYIIPYGGVYDASVLSNNLVNRSTNPTLKTDGNITPNQVLFIGSTQYFQLSNCVFFHDYQCFFTC